MTDSTAESDHGFLDRLARHRTGLAAMSFAESTVVPIPLETVVAPLMVGHPRQALTIATAIWIGCLGGALLFYAAGAWLAEPVVRPALAMLGLEEDFVNMSDKLGSEGLFWTVFLVSFSPAPMQLATLGAGAAHGNVITFISAIALSRGLRYFGLAILAQIVGPRIAEFGIPKRYLIPWLVVVAAVVWGIMQLV
ncbi:YqaA family protein [Tateyamaria pelophila]|uniref:YqaA family protein n=1 Tax=Tateyamaria pelophila TaxID=328415 RepID=UPI001CC08ADC|nr:hypothetical protein [Tateyamaria pelophila]